MSSQQIETLESALAVIWSAGWRLLLVGVSLTELIQAWSAILLTLVTVGYTLWRWRRDVQKDRQAATVVKPEPPAP